MGGETKPPAALAQFRAAATTLQEIDRLDALIARLAAGYCVGQNFWDLGATIREEVDSAAQIDLGEIDASLIGRLALGGIYSHLIWLRSELAAAIADVVYVGPGPSVDALLRAEAPDVEG